MPEEGSILVGLQVVAVELGLCLAQFTGLLEIREDRKSCFLVRSDNAGVVAVVNKGGSKSVETNNILKEIYAILAKEGIRLVAVHVAST